MSAEQKCVPAVRALCMRLAPNTNAGKLVALPATVAVGERAVGFYSDLFLGHPGVFAQRQTDVDPKTGEIREKPWNDHDRLTWAESVTMATTAHPDIAPGRSLEAVCPGAPRDLRRAAIHAGRCRVPWPTCGSGRRPIPNAAAERRSRRAPDFLTPREGLATSPDAVRRTTDGGQTWSPPGGRRGG